MSQLDISIIFSHFFGLVISFYIFCHYLLIFLIKFWYNQKLRSLEIGNIIIRYKNFDNNNFIIKVLNL